MTVRVSTGLGLSMLGNFGLRAMMNYGYIAVHSGVQPDSPDQVPTGTRLGRITTNGDPFVVGSLTGGALQVSQGEFGVLAREGVWTLRGEDTGTAGWWRWHWNAFDDDTQSFYYPRMDGAVGESLFLEDSDITAATSLDIESFNVQFRG